MPNHVKNIVKMEGITKLPLFKTEYDEYEKRDVVCFDFNKIIPMPESLNMVSGSLETLAIEAVNRRLSQRRYRFQQGYSKPQMTDEEYRIRLESHEKTEEELLELGLQYISNKVKYGATTWYDWCCDNWGTKWNAYSNESGIIKERPFNSAASYLYGADIHGCGIAGDVLFGIQKGPEILPPDDVEALKGLLMQKFPGLSETEGVS